jgi:hypothetical protein
MPALGESGPGPGGDAVTVLLDQRAHALVPAADREFVAGLVTLGTAAVSMRASHSAGFKPATF